MCVKCGRQCAGVKHVIMDCKGWDEERDTLGRKLKQTWGESAWDEWVSSPWDEKLAKVLGFTGGCSAEHRKAVEDFLINVKNFEVMKDGKKNMGCARSRGLRGWEGW